MDVDVLPASAGLTLTLGSREGAPRRVRYCRQQQAPPQQQEHRRVWRVLLSRTFAPKPPPERNRACRAGVRPSSR